MVPKTQRLQRDTRLLLGLVLVLTVIGVIFIYSASSIYALEKFGSAQYYLKKQLIYLLPALATFFFFSLIPIALLKRFIPAFFLGSLLLCLITILPQWSVKIHGSRRWLTLLGCSFQPSELLKFSLFLYLGLLLERKQHYLRSFAHCYLPFMVILGVSFLVLLKQPDFGSVVTILVTTIALLFVAEVNMMHLGITVFSALPVLLFLIITKPYRLNRVLIFLNPWSDPRGRGFQIIQSLIAIGSGHKWGLGIANSKQKFFYLPMQHTDFIFSIIAEETGFVGSCMIITCFFVFCWLGYRICLQFEDLFAFYVSFSFVTFITLQALINLMVTTGLLPTKGLGLPFISFGGTALLVLYGMVGLFVNFTRVQCGLSK